MSAKFTDQTNIITQPGKLIGSVLLLTLNTKISRAISIIGKLHYLVPIESLIIHDYALLYMSM